MFELLLGNFWFLLFGMIAIIAIAEAWQKVRRGEQETELKRDMLQRGLSVEEMERVLRAGSGKQREPKAKSGREERIVERLAVHLGQCRASAAVIDEVLTAVRGADSSGKQAIERAIQGLVAGSSDGEIKEEQILAVVRALCWPGGPVAANQPAPAPTSTAIQRMPDLELESVDRV